MNKLVLITTAMVFSFSLMANEPKDHHKRSFEDRSANKLEFLTIVLDLTNQQVKQVGLLQEENHKKAAVVKEQYKPILDEMKATLKPLRENPSEENKAKAKEIRASYKDKLSPMKISIKDIRDGFDNSLLEILSKDQGKKYLKLKALKVKQKESHKGKGLHGKPSPRSK